MTYCYGVGPDGAVVGAVFADGAFIPLGARCVAAARRRLPRSGCRRRDSVTAPGSSTTEMAPGNYRATIDSEGFFDFCDYSRLADASGTDNGVIADYHEAGEGEQVLVTIEPTDFAFESNGCGHWTLVTG